MTEQVKPERKGALVTGSSRGIGRAVCTARKPDCESCTLRSVCQFAEQQG